MLDFNGAAEQKEDPEDERRKIDLQFLIDEAVKLITDKIPTNRQDLHDVAVEAWYAGVEVPWEIIARIKGGMPSKRGGGPPKKVSLLLGDFQRTNAEYWLITSYHGNRTIDFKPTHIEIRNRETRLKQIRDDVGLKTLDVKSLDAILTRWRKANPDYKEKAFI